MKNTKELKRKKPKFLRQDFHKKKRISPRWRSARGLQSKIRLAVKGYRKKPKIGYGTNLKIKNMHPTGIIPIRVFNITDLKKINKETQGIIIAKIGLKNKLKLIEYAIKEKITILNIKNPNQFLKDAEMKIKMKKQAKKKKQETKKSKEKHAQEKAKEKQSKEKETIEEKTKELTVEEQEKEKKRKQDKILTKKE